MTYKILILGASYGSLLGTKLAAAGHHVTLVCRAETAALINSRGTEVRIKLRDEETHRSFRSGALAGTVDAVAPEDARPQDYDLVCLAMQEPQYAHPVLSDLLSRIAAARVGCMSIMNMPPLPYMHRIPGLDCSELRKAYTNPRDWDSFEPALMTLCSPDPQAYRPPDEEPNVLHVGLPTNFKVSKFNDPKLDTMLETFQDDIEAYRVDGKEVPVKLRVFDSLFVPFAKWAMLAAGNYRCITPDGPRSIREAVHDDPKTSRDVYEFVTDLVMRLGAEADDMVPFEKYAKAAEHLRAPSSAARAVFSATVRIERVDKLIEMIARQLGTSHPEISRTVEIIDEKLAANKAVAE